ncbi:hypothetical protein ACFL3V_03290, partial [Nanoarchaeota archaeon]
MSASRHNLPHHLPLHCQSPSGEGWLGYPTKTTTRSDNAGGGGYHFGQSTGAGGASYGTTGVQGGCGVG